MFNPTTDQRQTAQPQPHQSSSEEIHQEHTGLNPQSGE